MEDNLHGINHDNYLSKNDERYIAGLQRIIRAAVRVLAFLMVVVIWFGVADVVYVLYMRISSHPLFLIEISDILATFGAFMAVLIAMEIFINIVSYLRNDAIQIEIVIATAYMAILRKVIVLDYKEIASEYVYATAAVVIALSIGYWLSVVQKRKVPSRQE
ncbi:phosphate-starvation-inducible PsiE family protein [Niveibacterium terrae]|uniref:phosphate-starvation-inducible PsiE family protein n=1 Tax=Niveibacterium terrae TaxID=3373598 RepID=UPI003A92CCAF